MSRAPDANERPHDCPNFLDNPAVEAAQNLTAGQVKTDADQVIRVSTKVSAFGNSTLKIPRLEATKGYGGFLRIRRLRVRILPPVLTQAPAIPGLAVLLDDGTAFGDGRSGSRMSSRARVRCGGFRLMDLRAPPEPSEVDPKATRAGDPVSALGWSALHAH